MAAGRLLLSFLTIACISCDSATTRDVFISSEYVEVQSTSHLDLFYPQFSDMRFFVGNLSELKDDDDIIFCCGAAFTGARKFSSEYSNVAGPYVSDGILYEGYDCPYNTGAFVYSKGDWEFIGDSLYSRMEQVSLDGGMGFSQIMCKPDAYVRDMEENVIFSIGDYRLYTSMEGNIFFRSRKHRYRALCEKEGRLCIAQMQMPSTYRSFKKALEDAGISKAIYLDVGLGWSYGWYRVDADEIQEIGLKIHPFISNWLLFLK